MEKLEGESAPVRRGGRVARGARAVEALLLREVATLDADARRDPARLALPVRIVVPSRSLRVHVAAALVRARGSALVGVAVQTLPALALEIVERAGETVPGGDAVLPVLARRLAREEPTLRAIWDLPRKPRLICRRQIRANRRRAWSRRRSTPVVRDCVRRPPTNRLSGGRPTSTRIREPARAR